MSRALSTHQGKGRTDEDAQVGALLEAAECHAAERFAAEGPVCRFDALPGAARAPQLDDYARSRRRPPDPDAIRHWVAAERLGDGQPLYLPFDLVSLDLTRRGEDCMQRSSDGNAAGITQDAATIASLCEAIERDALVEWRALGLVERSATAVAPDSIPFGWLGAWRDRLNALAMPLRLYLLPAVARMPVLVCEIADRSRGPDGYRAVWGSGAHPVPEIALFRALAEALQSRAGHIAGAREDRPPSAYAGSDAVVLGFGLPRNPAFATMRWDEVASGPADLPALVAALDRAGYGQAAIVPLAEIAGFAIVKAFVCGLGAGARRRRPA